MARILAGIVCALLVLTACSAGDAGDVAHSGEPEISTTVGETGPAGASVGPGGSDNEWDPANWEPTVSITPISMSESEKQEFRTSWLAARAEEIGWEDPPNIPLERWVVGADFGASVGTCLANAGFEGVWDGNWGFVFPEGIPAAQSSAFERASYECYAKFFIDPEFSQEWSEDQVGLIYDYWDEFYVPCLEAHGVSVDMTSRPSRATFVATFNSPERSSWWPADSLMGLTSDRRATVQSVCNEYPPLDAFYGQAS